MYDRKTNEYWCIYGQDNVAFRKQFMTMAVVKIYDIGWYQHKEQWRAKKKKYQFTDVERKYLERIKIMLPYEKVFA